METKTKAFNARRALRPEEDAREGEECLRVVRKTLADALLNTVPMQGDLQREDLARLKCKVGETFNFQKYFPLGESTLSILHHLTDELEEYAQKLVGPAIPDQYIRDLPLEDIRGDVDSPAGSIVRLIGVAEGGSEQLANRGARMGGWLPSNSGWRCLT